MKTVKLLLMEDHEGNRNYQLALNINLEETPLNLIDEITVELPEYLSIYQQGDTPNNYQFCFKEQAKGNLKACDWWYELITKTEKNFNKTPVLRLDDSANANLLHDCYYGASHPKKHIGLKVKK